MHDIEEIVYLDSLIDYTPMIHEARKSEDEPEPFQDDEGDFFLALRAG